MAIPAIGALRVRALAMGKESSHCEGTPSTWTLAKDYLPVQLKATHSTAGVNWDLHHWFWWLRDNDAEVIIAAGARPAEIFGHKRGIFPLWIRSVNLRFR